MKRPKLVTVVLPAHGVEGAIALVVRDLAVAAYALRSRQMELDVLLLAGGEDRTGEIATATAKELGLDLTAIPAPAAGPGQAFLDGFRRVAHYGPADLVATMDATGHTTPPRSPIWSISWSRRTCTWSSAPAGHGARDTGSQCPPLGPGSRSPTGVPDPDRRPRDRGRDHELPGRPDRGRAGLRLHRVPVNSHSVQTAFVAMAIAGGYRVGRSRSSTGRRQAPPASCTTPGRGQLRLSTC